MPQDHFSLVLEASGMKTFASPSFFRLKISLLGHLHPSHAESKEKAPL